MPSPDLHLEFFGIGQRFRTPQTMPGAGSSASGRIVLDSRGGLGPCHHRVIVDRSLGWPLAARAYTRWEAVTGPCHSIEQRTALRLASWHSHSPAEPATGQRGSPVARLPSPSRGRGEPGDGASFSSFCLFVSRGYVQR